MRRAEEDRKWKAQSEEFFKVDPSWSYEDWCLRSDHFSTAEDCRTTIQVRVDWKVVFFKGWCYPQATLEDVLKLTSAESGVFANCNSNRQRLDTLITRDKIWTSSQA